MDTIEKLQMVANTLREISVSGYIPFASPAPSEAEEKIKENILVATARIESAIFWHNQIYK